MLQNQLENFISKQLLNQQVTQYLNELAQLNAKQSIQLQQAYSKISQLEKSLQQAKRVIDPSVKIVTDTNTQLMWAVNANKTDNFPNPNKPILWHQIDMYIAAANKQNYGVFNDWRLPTKEELILLFLPKSVNQSWIDTNLFFDTKWVTEKIYWTASTTHGMSKMCIYVVNFSLGFSYIARSENTYQLRLVRSM